MRNRMLAFLLCAVLFASLLSSCSGGNSTADRLSGVVNTTGSTSMEQVVGALSEAFQMENGGVTVNYSGTGSSTGIQGALDGTCDIGLSSRALKDEELARGVQAHLVALDGVAVIVNPANPVDDLTVEELAALAVGEIRNWSQLGGADAPVAFIGREAGSGTRSAFEEAAGVPEQCVYTNELTSAGDVIANVASNPNAIGYTSLSSLNETVKAVMVNGTAPDEAAIQDGSYTIQRPFVLVTREGAQLSPAAQAFLDYAMSSNADDIIRIAGAVPPTRSNAP